MRTLILLLLLLASQPAFAQATKGLLAIHTWQNNCQNRLAIGTDALFDSNKSTLASDARETLIALGPLLQQQSGPHPIVVEGHTDYMGTDIYTQDLSQRRAAAVRDWLIEQHYLTPAASKVQPYGKSRPVAPNANPDGTDNPPGRQQNRRIEIVIDTCK